jgi:hypothetical protein
LPKIQSARSNPAAFPSSPALTAQISLGPGKQLKEGALQVVFAYIPFGTYDIYRYDTDSSTDSLSLVAGGVELAVPE